jgi:hypothetical protein
MAGAPAHGAGRSSRVRRISHGFVGLQLDLWSPTTKGTSVTTGCSAHPSTTTKPSVSLSSRYLHSRENSLSTAFCGLAKRCHRNSVLSVQQSLGASLAYTDPKCCFTFNRVELPGPRALLASTMSCLLCHQNNVLDRVSFLRDPQLLLKCPEVLRNPEHESTATIVGRPCCSISGSQSMPGTMFSVEYRSMTYSTIPTATTTSLDKPWATIGTSIAAEDGKYHDFAGTSEVYRAWTYENSLSLHAIVRLIAHALLQEASLSHKACTRSFIILDCSTYQGSHQASSALMWVQKH